MGGPYKHFSEARRDAIEALKILLEEERAADKAVLIQDLFGRLRVVLWPSAGADTGLVVARVDRDLREAGPGYWTGDTWIADPDASGSDRIVYDGAWEEGTPITDRLRLDDRHRNRIAWFTQSREPPWTTPDQGDEESGPPIVVFSSFKGGVGRTTALAAFAIQRARAGDRVAIIDFDLDAPGAGTLLGADEQGTTAPWGVVDYLLERALWPVPIEDYVHRCARDRVARDGSILVVPAGRLDDDYLTKLSRIDLEVTSPEQPHPLSLLLKDVRGLLREEARGQGPAWILIDARAGLSPAAGLLLSGLAHLHVLFATTSEQSLRGFERIVHHLGFERLHEGLQGDVLVVQAMVPDNSITGEAARLAFASRVEAILTDHYLVHAEDDPEDRLWSVRDIDNREAPHVPIAIPYREAVAFFRHIDDIADLLAEDRSYRELSRRILGRFPELMGAAEESGWPR